ncbi:MAG: MFS transporter [Armatimonadetes bacterium]|nr:MFS transporter [Armatimonadota bacterium]MDE2205773.1 MFS transporter [Armatimonadota bacterium]
MMTDLDYKAILNGACASALLVVAIYLGSGRLKDFDPALIAYTSAVVFATFGIVYRYSVWLQKPPTRLYWRRGWQLFLRPTRLPRNLLTLGGVFWRNMVVQTFIERRSHARWLAHFLLSWGCIVAVAVTFPLVFGWVHFEADPHNPIAYRAFLFGIHAGTFPAASVVGWMTFHVLDFCAVAVILGMVLAMRRRMVDRGAMTVQQFSMDFLPLILLFAVSMTGLMLTVSSLWLRGYSYSFIALIHAFSVIVTLLYLPFGKFFHVFQRPANLGVYFYKLEGADGCQAACIRCGSSFGSEMHVNDLKTVLAELGMDYTFDDGTHYHDVCPACKRRLMATSQLERLESVGGTGFV